MSYLRQLTHLINRKHHMPKDHPLLQGMSFPRTEKCPYYGKKFANWPQHEKWCCYRPADEEGKQANKKPVTENIRKPNMEAPDEGNVVEKFKEFLEYQKCVKESTMTLYIQSMLRFFCWWEQRTGIKHSFRANNLLQLKSSDNFAQMVPIAPYLQLSGGATTMQATDIKA